MCFTGENFQLLRPRFRRRRGVGVADATDSLRAVEGICFVRVWFCGDGGHVGVRADEK